MLCGRSYIVGVSRFSLEYAQDKHEDAPKTAPQGPSKTPRGPNNLPEWPSRLALALPFSASMLKGFGRLSPNM